MTDTPDLTPLLPRMPFRVATLAGRKHSHVVFAPDAAARASIAAALGLLDLPEMRFEGAFRAEGKRDLVFEGTLRALVVQPCSISLAPVMSRIDEAVTRRYLADYTVPEGDEVEIPEDDSIEPLPEVIDAVAIALEALALALPLYPRARGVELGEAVFAAPGTVPLRNEDLRPFAGLAALAAKMNKDGA